VRREASRRVLVVGVGGIGSPAALALSGERIDSLALCDGDAVALENLPRQVLFEDSDVGAPKVAAAAARLRALRTGLAVEEIPTPFRPGRDAALLERFDVVIDGTDRIETKLALHADALGKGVAIAVGAALGLEGHAMLVAPGGRPCYRCHFRDEPPPGAGLVCAEAGVWPVLPGLVGGLLSRLAMAYLLGGPAGCAGRLFVADVARGRFRERRVDADPGCPACGAL